jgi:DNA-directed RNA polymerase subunit H (RpoH/RPB5)
MAYTTKEKVIRIMGQGYYKLAQSDLAEINQDDTMINELIAEVDDLINMYCSFQYRAEDLATSAWLTRQATWMVAHRLSRRKGNPGNFIDENDEAMEMLERIRMGDLQLPNLSRYEGAPAAAQTPVNDNRLRGNKTRVDVEASTELASGQRPVFNPLGYLDWI